MAAASDRQKNSNGAGEWRRSDLILWGEDAVITAVLQESWTDNRLNDARRSEFHEETTFASGVS